ncbi:MAG: ribonuclease HII [Xanthomonadales bacterium]|nr:ribonuclease HII [Xanthomonadales bacterium]
MRLVAGVDEAGRGPLAGPVVVAAVILGPGSWDEITDSKLLAPADRDRLARQIRAEAAAWRVAVVHREEIDRINILQATLRGMVEVVQGLDPAPFSVLVDGNREPAVGARFRVRTVIGGDRLERCIGAASILAKTVRDDYMRKLDASYPGYNFGRHKGYATPEHLACLRRLGPTPEHRRSFAPVRECLQGQLL